MGKFLKMMHPACKCVELPNADAYGVGTVWQCDCGNIWELKKPVAWGTQWTKLGWWGRRKYER